MLAIGVIYVIGGTAMDKKPFKIDKNGTKYYYDYTCPRCGGAGGCDQWTFTGWTCFDCGGTGRRENPLIYKEYTPEYQAKLDKRRAKREAERLAKQLDEFNNHLMELVQKQGFNAEGKIYVVTGNTFEIKEELKEAGANYKRGVNWYFLESQDKYPTIELDYTECLEIYSEYGTIFWRPPVELRQLIIKKQPTDNSISQYVGEVGKRLDLELTFLHRSDYEIPSFKGWGTDTVYVNRFKDDNGNVFIWKSTSAYFRANEGEKVKVRGTVKEHSEYKGVRQTILQRCKVEEV